MTDRSASMAEVKAVHIPQARYDVVILGGGLAGLSLANQLMLARPQTRVLVTDKRAEAAPVGVQGRGVERRGGRVLPSRSAKASPRPSRTRSCWRSASATTATRRPRCAATSSEARTAHFQNMAYRLARLGRFEHPLARAAQTAFLRGSARISYRMFEKDMRVSL